MAECRSRMPRPTLRVAFSLRAIPAGTGTRQRRSSRTSQPSAAPRRHSYARSIVKVVHTCVRQTAGRGHRRQSRGAARAVTSASSSNVRPRGSTRRRRRCVVCRSCRRRRIEHVRGEVPSSIPRRERAAHVLGDGGDDAIPAELAESAVPPSVGASTRLVVGPVHLDDEASLGASEVDDVRPDDELPTKGKPCLLPGQPPPEPLFGASGREAHESSALLEDPSLVWRDERTSEHDTSARGRGRAVANVMSWCVSP